MNRISRFQIHGFRRLHDVNLEMRPLMVMIGANGVGKTSVLDALHLLAASALARLNPALNDMGGISNLLTADRAQVLSMTIDMTVPHHQPLVYDLRLEARGSSYAISSEMLTQEHPGQRGPFKHIESRYDDVRYYDPAARGLKRPTWNHNPLETSLSQVPKMFEQPEDFRRTVGSASQYHVLDVGDRAPVKLPQQMKPAGLPGEDGEDLVPFLYSLRETDPDRYDTISDTMKAALPGFEGFNFPPVAAGMLAMTLKEKNFRTPLYMNQLSEGTLRFLWLVSLLQSPGLSTITMIDEPEVSLHPEMLRVLADLFREAAQRTLLVVATHSDRLISFLEPKEVLVMNLEENGLTSANWADALDLDEWLHDYTLDEVWRMGRMGGRS